MTKEKLLIIAYCFQKPSEFLSLNYIDGFFFLFRKSCWVVATLLLFLLVLGIAWYLLPFLHLFVFQWVPVLIAFDLSCIYSTLQLCPLPRKDISSIHFSVHLVTKALFLLVSPGTYFSFML